MYDFRFIALEYVKMFVCVTKTCYLVRYRDIEIEAEANLFSKLRYLNFFVDMKNDTTFRDTKSSLGIQCKK